MAVVAGLQVTGPERALYLPTGLEDGFRCIPRAVLVAIRPLLDRAEQGLRPLLVATTAVLTDDFRGTPALLVLAVRVVRGGDRA
jgi:hypothetical protein